jgi:hypothetical protein
MECEQVRQRLTDFLTAGAEGVGDPDMREHLERCAACREEAASLERVWSGLARIPATEPNSAAMRARFASMLEGYEHGREGANASALARAQATVLARGQSSGRWDRMNGWLSRWWPRQPLVQLAAAAVLLVLGVAVGRAGRPAPANAVDEIASVRSELREMRQMVTLTLMQQQSASDRLKGVSWSSTLERPGNEVVSALLDTLLHDPNVNVRLASIDALARFADEQQVRQGAVDALQSAGSPMVQIALIDFVVGVRETGSIETLKKLAADPSLNETVRVRASQGLDRLGVKS